MKPRASLRLAIALVALATPAHAAIFPVTSTADAGAGSLRQAIEGANGSPVADRIEFDIDGDGPHVIQLLGALQELTGEVAIDGLTQSGASCDTWPPVLQVVLDGSLAGATATGLVVGGGADRSVIQGLVLHSFAEHGIEVQFAEDVQIHCNFIGTDATGTADEGNGGDGVHLYTALNTDVGGAIDAHRNLISGNAGAGVGVYQDSDESEVVGNRIGTDVTGMAALPNDSSGVMVRAPAITIGGPGADAGNLISGNFGHGVGLTFEAVGTLVFSNRIGVDATGAPVLGNHGDGVIATSGSSDALIGAAPFEEQPLGNVIAGNDGAGVSIYFGVIAHNSIRFNSIFANDGLGIALLGDDATPTPNDPGDEDEGPNRLQNFPELASATWNDATEELSLAYRVPTDPENTSYPLTVDLYRADADGQEGEALLATDTFTAAEYLGSPTPTGVVVPVLADLAIGDRIVATATDAAGNTSEFSPSILVPEPGAAAQAVAACAVLGVATRGTRRARDRASRAVARG